MRRINSLLRPGERFRISTWQVIAAVAVIAVADGFARWDTPSIGLWGMLDEPAHAATALIALAALGIAFERRIVIALLAGSVLIDADHIPRLLGSHFLTHGTPRPYTHSLLTVVVVLGVALLLRAPARRLLLVAWAGLLIHFYRDFAEPGGPGISLLWPFSRHAYAFGYLWYGIPVGLMAVIAVVRRARERSRADRLAK